MSDFKDAYDLGAETKIVRETIEGVEHVLVPGNCELKSMEHLLPKPTRIRNHCTFSDLESFNEYIGKFKEEDSVIYLDELNRNFKTIFDHHGKNDPSWGDHSANLKLYLSNEWERFKEYDGTKLQPKQFAELIEDNINYISADDMQPADIITLAQNFRISVKGEVEVDETLHAGRKKLVIKDDSTVSAQSGGREITIPETLNVSMRFFRNGSTYSTKVYLRYRIEHGNLYFFIKIPDPEGIEEKALNEYAREVEDLVGLKILKGVFSR